MPRDWDLLAIAGVPLSVLAFYLMVGVVRTAISRRATLLAIVLGMIVLFSRAAVTIDTSASISHFINYLNLDGVKGMTGWRVLADYYTNSGQQDKADAIMNNLSTMYAHGKILGRADSLLNAGNPVAAKPLFYQVLAGNPIHHPAWFSLGTCYMDLRRLDSARICFEIADALNPYNPNYLNNLGGLYYYARKMEKAEELWERSYTVDHNILAASNLAQLYRSDGRNEMYTALVQRVAVLDSATVQLVRELANVQVVSRDVQVKATLKRLLEEYADTAWVNSFYQRYPNLR
jgi:Flp pilus assembly protein TadD